MTGVAIEFDHTELAVALHALVVRRDNAIARVSANNNFWKLHATAGNEPAARTARDQAHYWQRQAAAVEPLITKFQAAIGPRKETAPPAGTGDASTQLGGQSK